MFEKIFGLFLSAVISLSSLVGIPVDRFNTEDISDNVSSATSSVSKSDSSETGESKDDFKPEDAGENERDIADEENEDDDFEDEEKAPAPVTISKPVSSTPTKSSTTTVQKVTPAYTLAQISTHSNSLSCWTTVNGSVYDVTSFISQHKGGDINILSICGKDGSSAFGAQHGGQNKPENTLASFKIGVLAK